MLAKIARLVLRLENSGRITLARIGKARVGKNCQIGPGCEVGLWRAPHRIGEISIGDECQLSCGCILYPYRGKIRLGKNTFLGPYVIIYGHGGVEIGEDVLVSAHCQILSSNHTIPLVGFHIRWQPDRLLPTKIGNDVWLGAGVVVLGGITIGDGCVIGAGSVVTHDIPPNTIAVGVPAKPIRTRDKSDGGQNLVL